MIKCFDSFEEAVTNLVRIKPDERTISGIAKLAADKGLHAGSMENYSGTVFADNIEDTVMLHFKKACEFDWLTQSFSTRLSGVSTGIYESMNLSFNLLDSDKNVLNNFKKIAKSIGISVENMVYSKQTHTANILVADEHHKGMGIVAERDFDDIDGLITDKQELCLVTSFADCIPVIIIDTAKRVIASLHSGWRGTVANISKNALDIMVSDYGSNTDDLIGLIGTGICRDCYEVSADVAERFSDTYLESEISVILHSKNMPDKFGLDLLAANRINLINSGIHDSNIFTADICTCCNPKFLWSHRATDGKRGLMCNFIYIR